MILIAKPKSIIQGSYRVFQTIRGGCWVNIGQFCQSVYRHRYTPTYRENGLGFRAILRKRSR